MASGDTLLIFTPYMNEPPASNFATLDVRNQHPVLDFDAGTDESALFSAVMPAHYTNSGITVNLWLTDTSDTNTGHASYWDVAFENMADQDLDSDSFASVQSSHVHPNGTSGVPVLCAIVIADGSDMDSVLAGDLFRLKVTRDADNGSDDWANDAELIAVELVET